MIATFFQKSDDDDNDKDDPQSADEQERNQSWLNSKFAKAMNFHLIGEHLFGFLR